MNEIANRCIVENGGCERKNEKLRKRKREREPFRSWNEIFYENLILSAINVFALKCSASWMCHVCFACMPVPLLLPLSMCLFVSVCCCGRNLYDNIAHFRQQPQKRHQQKHYIVIWFLDGFLFRFVSARERVFCGTFPFLYCLFVCYLNNISLFISFVFSLKLVFAGFTVSSFRIYFGRVFCSGISRARVSDFAICFWAHRCCFFLCVPFFCWSKYFFNAMMPLFLFLFSFSFFFPLRKCSNILWYKACGWAFCLLRL